MSWFKKRYDDLRDVVGPTSVTIRGTVLDGPRVESPFTGVRARVFAWRFSVNMRPTLERRTGGGNLSAYSDPGLPPALEPAGRYCHSDQLRIAVGELIVALPPAGFDIELRHRSSEAIPIDRPWPALIPPPGSAHRGQIYFVEQLLCPDDPVELVAIVEPNVAAGGAYRGGPKVADFVVRLDLAPVTLRELAP